MRRESLAAVSAFERSLAGVLSYMDLIRMRLDEALAAVRALVRELAGVSLHVRFQIGRQREALAAFFARINPRRAA
jgi:hypothetical protein